MLVIGLGNPILTDDGVGLRVAREVARAVAERADVEVAEVEAGGFALLDLLEGRAQAFLVDAVCFDGVEPGTVVRIEPEDLRTSLRIRSVHEIDLPALLALARKLQLPMPGRVRVVGIQAQDVLSFGERLTPRVEAAVAPAARLVLDEIGRIREEVRA